MTQTLLTTDLSLDLMAPAKINLALRVVQRLANGYHELDMLVGFARHVGDQLTIIEDDTLHFSIDGPFANALMHEDKRLNLVLKAAELLRDKTGVAKGAHIKLTKNLPVASGIGGGSADAAAVIKGLETLWGVHLPDEERSKLALALGADVPMCLEGVSARVKGIGEKITPLARPLPGALLLVNPGVRVSTRAVFEALDMSKVGGALKVPEIGFHSAKQLAEWLLQAGNHLQAPSIQLAPVIGSCLKAISSLPQCLAAQMTGSGATCFGVFETLDAAEEARQTMKRDHTPWWAAATTLV